MRNLFRKIWEWADPPKNKENHENTVVKNLGQYDILISSHQSKKQKNNDCKDNNEDDNENLG